MIQALMHRATAAAVGVWNGVKRHGQAFAVTGSLVAGGGALASAQPAEAAMPSVVEVAGASALGDVSAGFGGALEFLATAVTLPDTGVDVGSYVEVMVTNLGSVAGTAIAAGFALMVLWLGVKWVQKMLSGSSTR